jgi:hypothetical protein
MSELGMRGGGMAGRRALVMLLVLAVLSTAGHAVPALPGSVRTPAPFSIRVTPREPTGTVLLGQATAYRVRVRWGPGVAGPVRLRVSGLPEGTTATFVTRTGAGAIVTPAHPRASLIVEASATAPPGRYVLTIVGTSDSRTRRTTAPLRIVRPSARAVGLQVTPGSVAVAPGSSARYAVCLTRSRVRRAVTLSIGGTLPVGASGSFDPNPIAGGCSTLTVTTVATTPGGTYLFTVRGTGARRPIEVPARLVVTPPVTPSPTTPPTSFTISGDAPTLYPGGPASPIDLTFHNPGSTTVVVTGVTVTVTGTSAGAACPPSNFATTDFAYEGSGGVSVPGGQAISLQDAGVDEGDWPTVRMLDVGNQDACEGAIVTLSYASVSGGPRG